MDWSDSVTLEFVEYDGQMVVAVGDERLGKLTVFVSGEDFSVNNALAAAYEYKRTRNLPVRECFSVNTVNYSDVEDELVEVEVSGMNARDTAGNIGVGGSIYESIFNIQTDEVLDALNR
jgi:hypothetical protein